MKYVSLILIVLITLTSCSDDEVTKSKESDELISIEEAENLMNQVNHENPTDSTNIIETPIEEETKPAECDKLTSREEAVNLMKQVTNKSFMDSTKIVENLIGEWSLIGLVSAWFEFETAQECLKLTIDKNNIELEDMNTGLKSSTEWELKLFKVNEYTGFHLETNEDIWNNRIGMQIFSDNIMFGDGRVDDANIYIYEKLE